MPTGFKTMVVAGTGAATEGMNLISDLFGVGAEISSGVRDAVEEWRKDSEESKEQDKKADEYRRKLHYARQMKMLKRDMERLGYKSLKELQDELDSFFGK